MNSDQKYECISLKRVSLQNVTYIAESIQIEIQTSQSIVRMYNLHILDHNNQEFLQFKW